MLVHKKFLYIPRTVGHSIASTKFKLKWARNVRDIRSDLWDVTFGPPCIIRLFKGENGSFISQ